MYRIVPTIAVVAVGLAAQIPDDTEIRTTVSGLKYSVLEKGPGQGPSPRMGDDVTVHYTGWLTDGTKFDSSRDRGTPSTFTIGQVIPGWNEGLTLMKVGDRFKFTIPGDLAYGPRGRQPKIPPNATLVFEVELIGVVQLPTLPAGSKHKQQKTADGIVWEFLAEGKGEPVQAGKILVFRYAGFLAGGRLLSCTEKPGRDWPERFSGPLDKLPFNLSELGLKMQVGDKVRCQYPAGKALQQDSVFTFKLVELKDPLPVPDFRALDPNKTITTNSGLKYEVVRKGAGRRPKATDRVTVHYAGWLTDGTVFDSSHGRAETSSFAVSGVIRGWTEGVQLMAIGAVFLFEIPGQLAYGVGGSPDGSIPPNATLIFRIELVSVP